MLAGAGSGKTGVITRRIAWLIGERGVDPAHIIAVTFTNKAAREMKHRVTGLMGSAKAASKISVSTFHRLGLRMLREECDALGLGRDFSIVGPADSSAIIADIVSRKFCMDTTHADAVRNAVSALKNGATTDTESLPESLSKTPLVEIRDAYQRYLKACNAVDLDDMICMPRELLANRTDVLNRWRGRVQYLLVDEYQDTNATQYDLVRLLAGSGKGLMVVGDDDQSIYAWRGAMPENLGQLGSDFSDLEVIKLEQNYRSRGRILKLANHLISNNVRPFEKTLWSELGYGDPVPVIRCLNEIREVERVVSELVSAQQRTRAKYSDFAILYRSNYQSRLLEQRLMEMQVPYRLSGGLSFFDRTEIRDLIAYLRLIANPRDDAALVRIINTPRRGIGAGTLEKIGAFARDRGLTLAESIHESELLSNLTRGTADKVQKFSTLIMRYQDAANEIATRELIDDLLEDIGYRDWLEEQAQDDEQMARRWQNIMDLADWITRATGASGDDGEELADVIRKLILADMLEKRDDEEDVSDKVNLMTLHAAKGLEFDNVFIIGVEEGILPHANSGSPSGIEEERRLLYVGITRARFNLTLSFCARRRRFGEVIECQPSRFLDELPRVELDWQSPETDNSEGARQASRSHLAGIRAMLSR
ncbi:MAG: ATP-dependent DNA helicase Rep [marine bacterium B5-7]|nr:MAG: ATP-dependent DNA helicase Rep [marine bacterium B5-7]